MNASTVSRNSRYSEHSTLRSPYHGRMRDRKTAWQFGLGVVSAQEAP